MYGESFRNAAHHQENLLAALTRRELIRVGEKMTQFPDGTRDR